MTADSVSVTIAGRRVKVGMSIAFTIPRHGLAIGHITRIDKSARVLTVIYNGKEREMSFEAARAAAMRLNR